MVAIIVIAIGLFIAQVTAIVIGIVVVLVIVLNFSCIAMFIVVVVAVVRLLALPGCQEGLLWARAFLVGLTWPQGP